MADQQTQAADTTAGATTTSATATGTAQTDASKAGTTDAGSKTSTQASEGAASTATAQTTAELKIKLPEGMQENAEYMGGMKTILGDSKLSAQERAQKLVDHHFDQVKKSHEAETKRWEQTKAGWLEELKNDAQFGGKNFDANIDTANKLLRLVEQKVPGFQKLLTDTGLGNHPVVVKALQMLGAATADDKLDVGAPNGATSNDADALYRQMYPNSPGLFAKS